MMNLKELKKLVSSGESDRLEFKTSTGQRSQAMKTVCGMLNGLGGFVLFGVSDKGYHIGQDITAKTMTDVSAELNRIDPPAFPDVETVALENGNPQPEWRVRAGSVVVKFKPLIDKPERQPESGVESQSKSQPESQSKLQPESQPESGVESIREKVIQLLSKKSLSKSEISKQLGQKQISGQLKKVLMGLVKTGVINFTIPEKPKSGLQKYRLVKNQ